MKEVLMLAGGKGEELKENLRIIKKEQGFSYSSVSLYPGLQQRVVQSGSMRLKWNKKVILSTSF